MDFLIAGVVALTSASAYVIASRWLGLPSAGLWMAIRRLLECLGTAAIFTVVNLSAAAAVILIARVLAGHFMSAYLLDDEVWLVVSALQGLTWALWRQAGRSEEHKSELPARLHLLFPLFLLKKKRDR